MTTKERIVEEALTLFAANGYEGTSVKNIADAVGIKDSSLYKHFASKREIFNTIVKQMQERIGAMSLRMGLPGEETYETAATTYARFGVEKIVEVSKQIFLFYLTDSYVSRFWKLATMEQFHDPQVYQVYSDFFLNESIQYEAALFREMSRQGYFIEADATVMAINFYAPIFFLLSKYMDQPEKKEEALYLLEAQVREFCRIYVKIQ